MRHNVIGRERDEHELEKLRIFFERVMLDKSRAINSFSYNNECFLHTENLNMCVWMVYEWCNVI